MLGCYIGRVRGRSMLPRITPDSFIIAIKFPRCFPKKVGQMYYLHHPRYGRIVKTLDYVGDNGYRFRGESSESLSSTAMGILQEQHVLGRVVWVIAAPMKGAG